MINKINTNPYIIFTGTYEHSKNLDGKLDNLQELKRLAEVSDVDRIRTNLTDNSKFLTHNNIFTTVSSKIVNNEFVYGVDCVILPKEASNREICEKVFDSAQKSLGKLFGKIAKNHPATEFTNQKKTNILKRFFNLFKKHKI